jgi:hypothetical protein
MVHFIINTAVTLNSILVTGQSEFITKRNKTRKREKWMHPEYNGKLNREDVEQSLWNTATTDFLAVHLPH